MTTPSFIEMINSLSKAVDNVNAKLIDNVTSEDTDYRLACIKPNITAENYFTSLKKEWENIVNYYSEDSDKCSSITSRVISILQSSDIKTIDFQQLNQSKIEEAIIDNLIDRILTPKTLKSFQVDTDLTNTLLSFISILKDSFFCQIFDIYVYVMSKYSDKFRDKILSLDREKIKGKIMFELENIKKAIQNTNRDTMIGGKIALENDLVNKLTGIYDFSVESELNRLIPEQLGSLKKFFKKIISTYYENLHPIIWAQIIKQMINNVLVETPSTPDEMFQFASKYLLLNSGPFILKILQMIKPVLTPELIKKYNLAKLTYPLMSKYEVNLILEKIIPNWELYKIVDNKSASVGHVCIVYRVDNPSQLLVIKIIKPISIVQSCWEYKTLYNIFEGDRCSTEFIRNMLESNGRELNVVNEKINLDDGHKYYTDTYKSVLGYDVHAKLTTIQALTGVPKQGTWFALGMTLAPGVPLSELIEEDLLQKDTIFRAKLHRCLDLFVYKFFNVLITKGFYHGDPHAGNIFFSFQDSQITLIDFGAVGHIDLFANDPSIKTLLEIIIMSIFDNYDEIFDKMTDLVNSKCDDIMVDKQSKAYIECRNKLLQIKATNIANASRDKIRSKQNENRLFSDKRFDDEQNYKIELEKGKQLKMDSIYSLLEYEYKKRDSVILNSDVLENINENTDTESNPSIPFSIILEKMIGFYALAGTNVAIKFSEFYELQKAYALLLGVLSKTNYSSYRIAHMTKRAIMDIKNAGPALSHIGTTINLTTIYFREKNIYNEYKKNIESNNTDKLTTQNRVILPRNNVSTSNVDFLDKKSTDNKSNYFKKTKDYAKSGYDSTSKYVKQEYMLANKYAKTKFNLF